MKAQHINKKDFMFYSDISKPFLPLGIFFRGFASLVILYLSLCCPQCQPNLSTLLYNTTTLQKVHAQPIPSFPFTFNRISYLPHLIQRFVAILATFMACEQKSVQSTSL